MNGLKKRDITGFNRGHLRASFPMKTSGNSVRDRNFFHKVSYPAIGTPEVICFDKAKDATGVTNMDIGGAMGKDKDFFNEGFDLIPVSAAATEADRVADLEKLLNTGFLVLVDEDDKEIFSDGPLRIFVSDRALIGVNTTMGNGARDHYMLRNPFNIEAEQRFGVKLVFKGTAPVLTAAVSLTVRMLGQEHKAAMQH